MDKIFFSFITDIDNRNIEDLCKKKLLQFDNSSLAKAKSILFYELSTKNEKPIYEHILKIFMKK